MQPGRGPGPLAATIAGGTRERIGKLGRVFERSDKGQKAGQRGASRQIRQWHQRLGVPLRSMTQCSPL
ncbi:MAG: hypothetical protein DLM64_07760 [Solirubrobacterales bacterium]|nr:MAG: hypothetical protein DLM64_07760 [Solirubrobacterales bacterium]